MQKWVLKSSVVDAQELCMNNLTESFVEVTLVPTFYLFENSNVILVRINIASII